MVSLKKKPSYVARLPRYGHDLSRRVLFTSSVGQLLPVMYDFLSAGDKVTIDEELFTRTQPLKTPAFCRCTEHVYYFFVPVSQIDSYFGQAFMGIDDFLNSNDVKFQFNSGSNPIPKKLPNPSLRTTFSYGSMFDEFFNNSQYPIKGQTVGSSGNYETVAFVQSHLTDRYGIPVFFNAVRLLDLLNYGSNWITSTSLGESGASGFTIGELFINPNLLAVYQKICYDYFRNSDWDENKPMIYNLNYYIKLGSMSEALNLYHAEAGGFSSGEAYGSLFSIHYHPFKKDFYTNIFPSPLFDNYTGSGINSYNNTGAEPTDSLNSYLLSTWGVKLQETENSMSNKSDQGVYGAVSDDSVLDGTAFRSIREYTDGSMTIMGIFIALFLVMMFPPMALIAVCAVVVELIVFAVFRSYKNDWACVMAGTLYMPLTVPLLWLYYNVNYTVTGEENEAVSMFLGATDPWVIVGMTAAIIALCFVGSVVGMVISRELKKAGVLKK